MSKSGFILVEVLVALAIVAVSLAAAVRTSGLLVLTVDDVMLRTVARWVAENRIEELRAFRQVPATGEQHGDLVMAGQAMRWSEQVTATPNARFVRLEVRVKALAGSAELKHVAYLLRE